MEHASTIQTKALREYVTPKLLRKSPIHKWLVFPHSFAGDLVQKFIGKWNLTSSDCILDPFCGAGTTLVAARESGIKAVGYDLSPFAVFVSNAKTAIYDIDKLRDVWRDIQLYIYILHRHKPYRNYPDLINKAFTNEVLCGLEHLEEIIYKQCRNSLERDFFRLGLFSIIPMVSMAKASGGWLKWLDCKDYTYSFESLASFYISKIESMLSDLYEIGNKPIHNYSRIGDARYLEFGNDTFSAVITSPPYPNRHDYTRVFGVELMFGFLNWEQTRNLRYQSFHSHPEAKPIRPEYCDYIAPKQLNESLSLIKKKCDRPRTLRMLEGYFIDIFCSFREISRVCVKNAKVAIVLGNAQYYGVQLLVDEIAADIGEQVGMRCIDILTARIRGNSAQQMKTYGRRPSRESIIIFENC